MDKMIIIMTRFMIYAKRMMVLIIGFVIGYVAYMSVYGVGRSEYVMSDTVVVARDILLCDEDRADVIPVFEPPTNEDKEEFLVNGTASSFSELSTHFFYADVEEEGILYALIAANKYDIPYANHDVYLYLSGHGKWKGVDKRSKDWALYYLKRGRDMNETNSVIVYDRLFENGKNGRGDYGNNADEEKK